MGRTRRIGVAAAAVLAGVALMGCSGSKQTDPVEIGSLPADLGAPIDLTGKVADTGARVDWPDACGLLTDELVQSLLPQTESIVKTPESQTFRFHSVDDPLAGQGTEVEVPDSRCTVLPSSSAFTVSSRSPPTTCTPPPRTWKMAAKSCSLLLVLVPCWINWCSM